jgi:membrane associated rhomboid family serine protease
LIIPVSDRLRTRRFPVVNWTIIAVNIAVFVYMVTLTDSEAESFIYDWGFVSACIAEQFGLDSGVNPSELASVCPSGDRELLQPFTSMFVHGGLLHIASNMLFLWIFGDNVEDAMGHGHYLVFYVICGLGAVALQTVITADSTVPAVGASGALAGVMGAYLILLPSQGVRVILFPLVFMTFTVPAVFMIGFWFITQVFSGVASLVEATAGSDIAWWAHVGGFITGVVLIWFFRRPRRMRFVPG